MIMKRNNDKDDGDRDDHDDDVTLHQRVTIT